MTAYWRSVGYTYNKFVSTQAATLRNALKSNLQTNKVLERSKTDVKIIRFENGKATEPVALNK